MDENRTRAALDELLDYLEQVETESGAVLQFLRDNGTITDENLAPYLKQAANATDVKSRAIRARFDFLFTNDEAKPAAEGVPAANAMNTNASKATATRDQNAGNSQEEDKEAA